MFLVWSCVNFSPVRWKLTHGSMFLPPCLRRWTDGQVDWKSPTDRTLESRRLAALFTCGGQGRRKGNIQVKSHRDVKTGVNGSHAFPAKVYEPCTANLSCHETPHPCSFLPPSPVPALTQSAISSIIKLLCRPGFPPPDGQAACSFVGDVNWSFWAQLHGWYLFHMWHWQPLRAHRAVWVIILNEAQYAFMGLFIHVDCQWYTITFISYKFSFLCLFSFLYNLT